MQNTTNLNLKKPDYTDFADIKDINDNMDILDGALHDTQNSVATFTSSDVADGSATSWTTVTKVDSGETHKSIFAKMSQMFKNIRFLYKMLGTTDISSIGNGTVTNALSVLNANRVRITFRTITTDANGKAALYSVVPGLTAFNMINVNATGVQANLYCHPYTYNSAVYVFVTNGNLSTPYANQTFEVRIFYFGEYLAGS